MNRSAKNKLNLKLPPGSVDPTGSGDLNSSESE